MKNSGKMNYNTKSKNSKPAWIIDPVNNGYFIPQSKNISISISEQESMGNRGKKATTGNYAAAWINHGTKPDHAQYEYAICIRTTPEKMKKFAMKTKSYYTVINKDFSSHIVRHNKMKLTGYAIFDHNKDINVIFRKLPSAC